MKKAVALIIIVVLLAAGLGQWLLTDPGYVLVIRGHWRAESTLAFVLFALFVLWLVTIIVLGILSWGWRRGKPAHYAGGRLGRLTGWRLGRAFFALGKGDWQKAEKRFNAAEHKNWRYLGQLGAAFAAKQKGDLSRSHEHLVAAQDNKKGALFAAWLDLTWRANAGDSTVADELEEWLLHERDNQPLRELAAALARKEGDWSRLQHHQKHLPKSDLPPAVETTMAATSLRTAMEAGGNRKERLTRVKKAWRGLSNSVCEQPDFIVQYGEYLHYLGDEKTLLKLLDGAIESHWDNRYAALLAQLDSLTPQVLLTRLEAWLTSQTEAAELALLAGRTALKANLWGKADEFFRRAGRLGSVPAWAELARLKQAQGDDKAVQECLIEQSQRVSGSLPDLPLPRR